MAFEGSSPSRLEARFSTSMYFLVNFATLVIYQSKALGEQSRSCQEASALSSSRADIRQPQTELPIGLVQAF